MEEIAEHLDVAVEEIRQANSKAPLGTGLMLGELLDEAEELRARTWNIVENNDGE